MTSIGELLADKTAIVTGGAGGIGAEITRSFCAAGASVFILDCDKTSGSALVEEIADTGTGKATLVTCDASEPRELETAIARIGHGSSRLDCLINNVGRHPRDQPIDDVDTDAFEQLLRVNLTSCYAASRTALPFLRNASGSIVNLSSLVSRIGQQLSAAYVASKGGISALTRALAIDEARYGVRVNAVLPGVVDTASHRAFVQSQVTIPDVESWQWFGRVAQPIEVAQACLFLASELSSFITGAEIVVSGGAELGYSVKPLHRLQDHPQGR